MAAVVERRFTAVPVEVRASETGPPKIGGYAAIFNSYSQNLGGFVEEITPSFFNYSRSNGWPDVLARYNHDDNMVLGTTGGNTMDLTIDETGLLYEVTPPKSRQDVVELIQRGDVRKSSFAFRLPPEGGDEWVMNDQGFPLRRLVSGSLVDVAPVNSPAYTATSVGMRSTENGKSLHVTIINIDGALRSLAAKMDTTVDEVRSLADADDLRRFFARTDGPKPRSKPKPKLFGPAAALDLLQRREDPWV
jgi:HK97 family phage prohead protease